MRKLYVDDTELSTIEYFTIDKIDPLGLPSVDLKDEQSATLDGGIATNVYYRERIIRVSGRINAPNHDALHDTHRTLMSNIQGVNKELKWTIDGHNVVYTATLDNTRQSEPSGGKLDLQLFFTAQDPIGVTEGYFTTEDFSNTSVPSTTNLTIGGNYYAKPIITIHISALAVSNPSTMSVQTDSGTILISRDWTVGEVVTIDGEAGTVKVNDELVLYGGPLPRLNIGNTDVVYDDEFTTRTVNITVRYKKRYL